MNNLTSSNSSDDQNAAAKTATNGSTSPSIRRGISSPKPLPFCSKTNCIYLFLLLASFIVAVLAVAHPLLSWKLGLKNQLIVIGIMLRIMTECLQFFITSALVLFEYRYGGSCLQNYEAILKNSYLVPRSSMRTRITIILLIALPLVLSAVYKLFIGGESSRRIPSECRDKVCPQYGLAYPALKSYSGFNNSIYLFTNAYTDFQWDVSSGIVVLPDLSLQNAPYGYNLLILSPTSAAALDVPMPDYVSWHQSRLVKQEQLRISSSVNAFVATYNTSLETFRENDTFWEETFAYNRIGFNGMTSFSLFDPPANNALGFMPRVPNQQESASCLLGIYPGSSTFWTAYYNSATSQDSIIFRNHSMMFSVTRTRCNATWVISKTSIRLVSGSCADRKRDHITIATDVLDNPLLYPYPLDTLPVLVKTIGDLEKRAPKSTWRMPTYVSSVVMSYWARAVFMFPLMTGTSFNDIRYKPEHEEILSTRATLKARKVLYFVLAIQPILGLLAFGTGFVFYKIPTGPGFGVASILAGIDTTTLEQLEGAALSGESSKPIGLDIEIVSTQGTNRIRYSLIDSKVKRDKRRDSKIQKGQKYA